MILKISKLSNLSIQSKISTMKYEVFIPFLSVKDNIMFGRPYKEKRYKKTIEACELQHDLDMFPDGGLTEVGERNVYNTAFSSQTTPSTEKYLILGLKIITLMFQGCAGVRWTEAENLLGKVTDGISY